MSAKISIKAIILGIIVPGFINIVSATAAVLAIASSLRGEMKLTDISALIMSSMPVLLSLPVLLIFIVITFCSQVLGGFTAGRIAKQNEIRHALIVGAVIVVLGLIRWDALMPLWSNLTTLFLTIPATYLGGIMSRQIEKRFVFIISIIGVIIVGTIAAATMPLYAPPKPPEEKTFSKGEVSFNYPGDWDDITKSISKADYGNVELIVSLGKTGLDVKEFTVLKFAITPGKTLQQDVAKVKEFMEKQKRKLESEKTITIDGEDAFQVTYRTPSGGYQTTFFLPKNRECYSFLYVSLTDDQKTLAKIINSIKIHIAPSVAVKETPPQDKPTLQPKTTTSSPVDIAAKKPTTEAIINKKPATTESGLVSKKEQVIKSKKKFAKKPKTKRQYPYGKAMPKEIKPENIARAKMNTGDYQEAINILTVAIVKNPRDSLNYRLRGNAFDNLGNREQAIEDWKKAAALGDTIIQSYLNFLQINW